MESTRALALFQFALLSFALFLLYLSQRFWFVRAWRLIGRLRQPFLRGLLRGAWMAAVLAVLLPFFGWMLGPRPRLWPGSWSYFALLGLWISSALLAFFAVQVVAGIEWLWLLLTRRRTASRPRSPAQSATVAQALLPVRLSPGSQPRSSAQPATDAPADPSRRYFFQTASYLAGAVPFIAALYGFAAGRLSFRLERVEVPLGNLPAALDGLRIVQLSDIHVGGYMPVEQVRRAVDMANELGADLAVVTGDFLTGRTDPLEACIAELARLYAPLGIWGCNGNHEIYAGAEADAAELFRQAGMKLLRRENAQLVWRGQPFNLIGVDYQRTRTSSGRRLPMLARVETLVRRDVPNILLSHNPNAFPRAAELGIELTLAGHTHGGQVQVEILDRRWSPARFITDFVAGLYSRPLALPADITPAPSSGNGNGRVIASDSQVTDHQSPATSHESPVTSHSALATAFLYVNRGLGTVGAPVRIGVPPEITLLTLRRA